MISGNDPHRSGFDSHIRPSRLARPPHADIVQQPGFLVANGRTVLQVHSPAPPLSPPARRFLLVSKMPGNRRVTAVQFRPACSRPPSLYTPLPEVAICSGIPTRQRNTPQKRVSVGSNPTRSTRPQRGPPHHKSTPRGTRMNEALQHPTPAQRPQLNQVRRAGRNLLCPFLWQDSKPARYPHPTRTRNPGWAAKTASRGRL